MLLPWMVYSTWCGALAVGVGLLGERVIRLRGWTTRPLWLAIIAVTVALPLVLNLFPSPFPPGSVPPQLAYPAISTSSATARGVQVDTMLIVLWSLASTIVLARILGAALILRRRRKAWIPATLGGQSVLLTDNLGPAVIGWRRVATVLPRWAMTLDEPSRDLILQHEAAHARSGDPMVRSLALIAVVLMPWNLSLWWALSRLRLAIEMDCDQRVLANGVDPQRYAAMLLAVGERVSAMPFAWATALGASRSSLEKRIVAMISPFRPRHPRLVMAALNVAAVAVVLIACASPVPDAVVLASAASPIAAHAKAPDIDSAIGVDVCDSAGCHVVRYIAHPGAEDHSAYRTTADCRVGSTCGGGPDQMVVFRKTLRDGCKRGGECAKEAPSVMEGDSIRLVADTVYLYRGKSEGKQPYVWCAKPGECAAQKSTDGSYVYPGRADPPIPRDAQIPSASVASDIAFAQLVLQNRVAEFSLANPPLVVPTKCTPDQLAARRKVEQQGGFGPRCVE